MPVTAKSSAKRVIFGRQATAEEKTRFNKFAREDKAREQLRTASAAQALEKFAALFSPDVQHPGKSAAKNLAASRRLNGR